MQQFSNQFDWISEFGEGGKPDLIIKEKKERGAQYLFELILAERSPADHVEHVSRFEKHPNYRDVDAFKCLISIGQDASLVKSRLSYLFASENNEVKTALQQVVLLGLVPCCAYSKYRLYVKSSKYANWQYCIIPVDYVGRSIQTIAGPLVSAVEFNVESRISCNGAWGDFWLKITLFALFSSWVFFIFVWLYITQ